MRTLYAHHGNEQTKHQKTIPKMLEPYALMTGHKAKTKLLDEFILSSPQTIKEQLVSISATSIDQPLTNYKVNAGKKVRIETMRIEPNRMTPKD